MNAELGLDDQFVSKLEGFIQQYKQKKKTHYIPLTIFSNDKLGIMESLVKYLHENVNLNFSEISNLINRNERTVWSSYNNSIKKHKEKFTDLNNDFVEVSIFTNRKHSPLQSVVTYLKTKGYTFKQISVMLNRDYKTIWLTYRR